MSPEIKLWIKTHKKKFANDFIKNSKAIPSNVPTAFFMAGLPGAGKTEFSKNFLETSKRQAVRIDMDEIATKIQGYRPEQADRFRAGASTLLNKIFDLTVKNGLDFIMDGTFSSKSAIPNINRTIEHGYKIKIIYIHQDPKLAWDFTLQREKIEHRAINETGFIESYSKIISNIKSVIDRAPVEKLTIDIIIKDSYNRIKEWQTNVDFNSIDKIAKKYYNKTTLKEYLK